MRSFVLAVVVVLICAFSAQAETNVGVSVQVGQPGFYGRIDVGNYPQPQVIYAKPVMVAPPPPHVVVAPQPVYLHVPPGHAKKWSKHCHKYNACGQPVYFVKDKWYNDVYVPQYQAKHGHGNGHGDKHNGNGKGHGNGKGNGKGHGKGHD